MINIVIEKNPFVQNSASANRLLALIEGVASLNKKVKMLIYGGYSSMKEESNWGKNGIHENIDYEYVLPAVVEGYWKVRFYNYLGHFFRNKKLIKKIVSELKQKEGIVWIDSSSLGFRLVSNLKKVSPNLKLFNEISEFLDIHHYNKSNVFQRWQGNAKQRLFENKAFTAYDGMALMTKTLLKHHQNAPSPQPKFLHLPMTVDLDRFAQKREALPEFEEPYIAYIGVLNNAKDGIGILIEAFAKIHDAFPNLKLYLVGPWHYDTPSHLQRIKALKLEDRIFWMKEYPRDQIPAILQHAELLALPRPDSKQAQGGFPTKLGEYLASGRPVCATTVGEIPDYLKDGESVFFAEPGSVDSFSEAMHRALRDKENALRVAINGRKVAERHFNKDIQAQKLYEFFQELIKDDSA